MRGRVPNHILLHYSVVKYITTRNFVATMELSEIAHKRLVEAGWEIDRFEESDFGKSAITSYNSVATLSSKRVRTGFGMALGSAVATVAGAILNPYTLLATPISLVFACKELFVRMNVAPCNNDLLSQQRRSHYIHKAITSVDKQLSIIRPTSERSQMIINAEKVQKQWKQFDDLLPVLVDDILDKSVLSAHQRAINQRLTTLLKSSSSHAKSLKGFNSAKENLCVALDDFKTTLTGLFDRATEAIIARHQSLAAVVPK